jgi:GNAT superfamily N-acetyltransferase
MILLVILSSSETANPSFLRKQESIRLRLMRAYQMDSCFRRNDGLAGMTGERLQSETGIMTTEIFVANTDVEIEACFAVFTALRPHVRHEDFLPQVRRQQSQSYQIVALRHEGIVKSAAGFRFAQFLAWGQVLYIDDLSTLPEARSQGYADSLLDWLIEHAKSRGCQGVHLDSGYTRYAAHRLYLRKGFQLNCHHLALEFNTL